MNVYFVDGQCFLGSGNRLSNLQRTPLALIRRSTATNAEGSILRAGYLYAFADQLAWAVGGPSFAASTSI